MFVTDVVVFFAVLMMDDEYFFPIVDIFDQF